MSWQPAPDSVRQLAACLKDSLSGYDKSAQKNAEVMLERAKNSPDINNYLAYLFSSTNPPEGLDCSETDYHLVRSAAGIMLKNNVKNDWKMIPEESLKFVKMSVPMGLHDKNVQIRNYAGNIATEVIRRGDLLSWPELLPQLIDMFGNTSGRVSAEAQEGAMSAMAKICEDSPRLFMREMNGQRPLNHVLPQLISVTKSPLPKVRAGALTAINVFTPRASQAMLNSIDDLLQRLFVLATDDDADVRRQVCRTFVHLVETRPDKLQPHIGGLVDYIISQQKGDDEDLACEAAEFWLAVGEHHDLWQGLQQCLHKIIPILLECMVYGGEDIALLGGASDDEDEEDEEQDIKPAFAKKKLERKAAANGGGGEQSESREAQAKNTEMDGDLEDGEIVDDDDGDENPDERWTLRKCSAAALDVFAKDFRNPVFEAIFPYLSQNLKHSEWPQREAAVLALGAVAEGCMDVVVPHLPELMPYLITLLEDPEPVVRQITCWTLGRYSEWAAHLPGDARQQYFVPLMDGILRKMLDRNKKVQAAAASAFANLESKAGSHLEPYCGPIIQQFVRCFGKYKDKNMYVLYDCVQTLAERTGSLLATPALKDELMPALNERYNVVSDQSREVFPLLECLSYVAIALGPSFAPYAPAIFARCINIIHTNLGQSLAAAGNTALDSPDKDFLVTSLDLLSAIIQALGEERSTELVKNSPQPFFELLTFCMEDPADEVRQSAYALLGDCADCVFRLMQPHLNTVIPIAVKQLDLDSVLDDEVGDSFGAYNNTCWSIGEITMKHGKGMAQWAPGLVKHLVEIMSNPRVPKSLAENAAIALGRLGLENSELLAPALPTFAEELITLMEKVEPTEEKASAFKGFSTIVAQNPQAMEKVLLDYFVAVAQYDDSGLEDPLKQELHDVVQHVLNVYKQMMPQFNEFLGQMRPRDRQRLVASYSV